MSKEPAPIRVVITRLPTTAERRRRLVHLLAVLIDKPDDEEPRKEDTRADRMG